MGLKIWCQVGELENDFQSRNFNMIFLNRAKSKAFQKHERLQDFFRKFDIIYKIS